MIELNHKEIGPGELDAADLRIGVVVSRRHPEITEKILDGALAVLEENGCVDITVAWVHGGLEVPLTALTLAETGQVDAVLCICSFVQGKSMSFQWESAEAAASFSQINLTSRVPCTLGVLYALDTEQALVRAANQGAKAARAAICTAHLLRRIRVLGDPRSMTDGAGARHARTG